MGAWIAYAFLEGRFPRRWSGRTMLVLGVAGFAAGLVTDYRGLPSVIGWGIPSALLVGGFVLHEMNRGLRPSLKKLAFLGDSSYFLYLSHILLLDVLLLAPLVALPKSAATAIVMSLVLAAICAFIAAIFFSTFERRLLAALRARLIGARRSEP
jgi:exopolysaccharide production protein ExoZ